MDAVIDNDIIIKLASYGLLKELVIQRFAAPGVLAVARFLVPKRLEKLLNSEDLAKVEPEIQGLFEVCVEIEPTNHEIAFASDIELAAQTSGLELDAGESQLCAIVVTRAIRRLVTGDKRAVKSLYLLLEKEPRLIHLTGRVLCLEQLFQGSLAALLSPA